MNCASRGPESWLAFKATTQLHTCATGYRYCSGKKHLLNFRCLLLGGKKKSHLWPLKYGRSPRTWSLPNCTGHPRGQKTLSVQGFLHWVMFCLCSDMRSLLCLTFSADDAAGFVPYYLAVIQLPNLVGSVCPKAPPRLLCLSWGLLTGIPRTSFPTSPPLPPHPNTSVRLESSFVSSRIKLHAKDQRRLPLTGSRAP